MARTVVVSMALLLPACRSHPIIDVLTLSLCELAQAPTILHGTIKAWGQTGDMALPGSSATAERTPLRLAVDRVVRGEAVASEIVVFVQGRIWPDGSTDFYGALKGPDGLLGGYFFLSKEADHYVVWYQGFYWEDQGVLKNAGVNDYVGIAPAEFEAEVSRDYGKTCPEDMPAPACDRDGGC